SRFVGKPCRIVATLTFPAQPMRSARPMESVPMLRGVRQLMTIATSSATSEMTGTLMASPGWGARAAGSLLLRRRRGRRGEVVEGGGDAARAVRDAGEAQAHLHARERAGE